MEHSNADPSEESPSQSEGALTSMTSRGGGSVKRKSSVRKQYRQWMEKLSNKCRSRKKTSSETEVTKVPASEENNEFFVCQEEPTTTAVSQPTPAQTKNCKEHVIDEEETDTEGEGGNRASDLRNSNQQGTDSNDGPSIDSLLAPFLRSDSEFYPEDRYFYAENDEDVRLLQILRYIKYSEGGIDLLHNFIRSHLELLFGRENTSTETNHNSTLDFDALYDQSVLAGGQAGESDEYDDNEEEEETEVLYQVKNDEEDISDETTELDDNEVVNGEDDENGAEAGEYSKTSSESDTEFHEQQGNNPYTEFRDADDISDDHKNDSNGVDSNSSDNFSELFPAADFLPYMSFTSYNSSDDDLNSIFSDKVSVGVQAGFTHCSTTHKLHKHKNPFSMQLLPSPTKHRSGITKKLHRKKLKHACKAASRKKDSCADIEGRGDAGRSDEKCQEVSQNKTCEMGDATGDLKLCEPEPNCPVWNILQQLECPFTWAVDIIILKNPDSKTGIPENIIQHLTDKEKEFTQAKKNLFREIVVHLVIAYEKILDDRLVEAMADLQHCFKLLNFPHIKPNHEEHQVQQVEFNSKSHEYYYNTIKQRRLSLLQNKAKDIADRSKATEDAEDTADSCKATEYTEDIADSRKATEYTEDIAGNHKALEYSEDIADNEKASEHSEDITDNCKATEHAEDIADSCKSAEHIKDIADNFKATEHTEDIADSRKSTEHIEDIADNCKATEHTEDIADSRKATEYTEDIAGNHKALEYSEDIADNEKASEHSEDIADNCKATEHAEDIADSRKATKHTEDITDNCKATEHTEDIADNQHATEHADIQQTGTSSDTGNDCFSLGSCFIFDVESTGSKELQGETQGGYENPGFVMSEGELEKDPELEKLQRTKAMEYVVNCMLAYMAYFLGSHEEAYIITKHLHQQFDELGRCGKATLEAIRGSMALEYNYFGNKIGLEILKKAQEMDPCYWEWNLICGKVMGRIRRVEGHNGKKPDAEELHFLEKAVELHREDASALVHLANVYRSFAHFKYREKLEAQSKSYSVIETRPYVRRGGRTGWTVSWRAQLRDEQDPLVRWRNPQQIPRPHSYVPLEDDQRDHLQLAKDLYVEALEREPNCPYNNARCAKGLWSMPNPYRDKERAQKAIYRAIFLAPDDSLVNHYAGLFYEFCHDYEKALECYERSIHGRKENYPAEINYVNLKLKTSEPGNFSALLHLDSLMHKYRSPNLVLQTLCHKGFYYYKVEELYFLAIRDIARAIKINPSSQVLKTFYPGSFYGPSPPSYNMYDLLEEIISKYRSHCDGFTNEDFITETLENVKKLREELNLNN